MATRKRNEWLDAEDSEEEERDYEFEDESRSRMLKSSKRRKVQHYSESDDGDDAADDLQSNNKAHETGSETATNQYDDDDTNIDDSPAAELAHLERLAANLPTDLKLISGSKPLLRPSAPKKDKSGVIYLSRVPPFMKPSVLRSLLTPYGPTGRIFLTPEPATTRQQRLKSGGTRRKLFLDGWVEFLSKKDAKFVAEALNAQTMGGKKRSRWHDEVWNIKYLSGVKWAHLVEQIQNENAERQARLRVEIARSKKENAKFLENVEKGKMISGIEAKRKEKGKAVEEEARADDDIQDAEQSPKPAKRERRSKFQQHEMRTKLERKPEPGQDVQRVLNSIF